MLLAFVTLDNQGQPRPFTCLVPQLEGAFDVLSRIVATGKVVVSVELLDPATGQRTSLPTEAFDGEPIAPHMAKLEESWQALLGRPDKPVPVPSLTAAHRQLYETYQTRINWCEAAIKNTESRLSQLPRTAHWASCHSRYEKQLTLFGQQVDQLQAWQGLLRGR